MNFGENLILSDSLFRLIERRRHESPCMQVLYDGLVARQMREREFKLAAAFPGNYFTFREKTGMISYMPKGRRQVVNRDGTWSRKGRQAMKPARWIKTMLRPRLAERFKDHAFAQFNAIVLHEELRTQVTFHEVSIREAYDKSGFIGLTSCMWDRDVAPFYEAFGCRALVATVPEHGSLYIGRAIIWPNVQVNEEKERITFLERIYCGTAEVSFAFREHASTQGWWRKLIQSADAGPFLKPNGEEVKVALTAFATSNLDEVKFYPYLDTLCYGRDNWVSSNPCMGHKWIYRSGSLDTAGTRFDASHEGQVLDYRGRWIDEDTAVQVNGSWYYDNSPEIVRCARSETYILRVDAYHINLPYDGDQDFYIHREFVRRMG